MISSSTLPQGRARLRASLGSLLVVLIAAACGGEGTGLATEALLPAVDSAAAAPTDTTTPTDTVTPTDTASPDSIALPPSDSNVVGETITATGIAPGIAFGTINMPTSYLTSVQTGTLLGGPLGSANIVSVLTETRNKGGRMVIKLCKGDDKYVKNPDGTFSLTKWKALVDQYRSVNLAPFITDGTILGHYLIDEPHRAVRWGGKIIPQATIEAMAAYSKQIWPTMPTLVRVVPSWLGTAPVAYTHLDAGWLQYTAGKGEVNSMVTAEVAAAKRLRLGLVVGMNVMAGGDGSSRIRGVPRGYAMSAAELRTYGTALLNQSYACGFFMWNHNTSYYGRTDIKTAMAELSAKARLHARTSCRQ